MRLYFYLIGGIIAWTYHEMTSCFFSICMVNFQRYICMHIAKTTFLNLVLATNCKITAQIKPLTASQFNPIRLKLEIFLCTVRKLTVRQILQLINITCFSGDKSVRSSGIIHSPLIVYISIYLCLTACRDNLTINKY